MVIVQAGLGFGRQGKRRSGVRKRDLCPCDSGKAYTECCEKFHNATEMEPDAETVMKARHVHIESPSMLSFGWIRVEGERCMHLFGCGVVGPGGLELFQHLFGCGVVWWGGAGGSWAFHATYASVFQFLCLSSYRRLCAP